MDDAKPLPDPEREQYPRITIDGTTYELSLTLEEVFDMEDATGVLIVSQDAAVTYKGRAAVLRSLSLIAWALKKKGLEISPEELMKKIPLHNISKVTGAFVELLQGKKNASPPIETLPAASQ